jgi:two-component system, OmpR family, sensor kinase
MQRIPIRIKVTAVFAVALLIVLTAIGTFLYLRLRAGLDNSINQGLRSRAGDVAALVAQADSGLTRSGSSTLTARGKSFAQVLEPGGHIFDATPLFRSAPLLTADQIRRALTKPIFLQVGPTRRIADPTRLLASPVRAQGRRLVAVVGVSLAERTEILQQLRLLLLLGGAAALVLVSAAGYLAVAAALRPVEAMRARARDISGGELAQRLPVPAADDEVARLGTTLNEMLARLQASFARERQFVSDASHELRTPLGILKTELELALRGAYTRDELEDSIRSAASETDRVIQLAEDLLVIARADQGQLPVRRGSIDLGSVVQDLRQRFERRADEQRRELRTEIPAGWEVNADRLRLEQALGNLVDNALRYGAGTITIAATRDERTVEIHVIDEGPGVSDRFAPIAFDRFTREDSSRGRGGSGLGLAIVQAIARAHGGHATVRKHDGDVDFSITIPDPNAPPTAARDPTHRDPSGRLTVVSSDSPTVTDAWSPTKRRTT